MKSKASNLGCHHQTLSRSDCSSFIAVRMWSEWNGLHEFGSMNSELRGCNFRFHSMGLSATLTGLSQRATPFFLQSKGDCRSWRVSNQHKGVENQCAEQVRHEEIAAVASWRFPSLRETHPHPCSSSTLLRSGRAYVQAGERFQSKRTMKASASIYRFETRLDGYDFIKVNQSQCTLLRFQSVGMRLPRSDCMANANIDNIVHVINLFLDVFLSLRARTWRRNGPTLPSSRLQQGWWVRMKSKHD